MLSTILEVCGFGCAIAGAAVVGGLGPALFVAAGCLLFMGFAAEGPDDEDRRGTKIPRPRRPRRKTKA